MIADFLPHFSGGLAIWALLCALDGTNQMRSHAVVIVAWIAIAIELIQGVAGIGDMSIADWIYTVAGAGLGYALKK